ncbi:TonB-dependent receptor [Simiduia aestuariiviva]|uniref:Iron complex outermembrane receptor protein n=1 Tax=Simiduia aestuariiviva TaxID=1510459 RepID=A0A839UMU1_9GAMM|nr:TonB-dependent receptor [Simiduia aestuariiviva]MBB3169494.1 iron complex outermembrane receptor protein [Simiduia aestuariiviva]
MHTKPIVAGIALAVASSVSWAQTDEANTIFEEVVVTAQKREQSIYEVPVAISAFSGDTMEKQGISDLTDIGKFVPNLNITGFSAGHTSSNNAFIRGIGLQDHLITTDPGVGVYVDGVYLGRQVGQNWSLSNIERVEVLRGPQGTLYGRNSIGGAINIITRAPGEEAEVHLGTQVGTRGRFNADIYASAPLSDSFAVSGSLAYQSRDGLGEFTNLPGADMDVGELQDFSGRVAARWTPTDKLSILFAADGNDGKNGLRPYTTLIDELPNGAVYQAGYRNSDRAADPYDNATGQLNQTEVTNKASGFSVTVDYDISDSLHSKLLFSDRHSEYTSGLDDDSIEADFLSFPEEGEADQRSIEFQLDGDMGDWDFVTGLYFFEEDGHNFQDDTVFNGGAPSDFFLEQSLESTAIYGNVGYHVNDKLRVSGGLRYTQDEKTAHTILFETIEETNTRDWSETSWELAANYDISENLNGYATIQSGYTSGQYPARPYCLIGSFDFGSGELSRPNCFEANDNVTALNYEVGIKGTPLDNLKMSLSLFHTIYNDLPYQVSTTSGGGFETRNLLVDQTSQGIEWESSLAVTDGFMLHSTLGYINADVDDQQAAAPLTPELTVSISPEYTMAMDSGELSFRADWSYRSEMYGEPSKDPGRFTKLDSRSLINVDITYRNDVDNWSASLYGKNITDERYDNARLNTGDYVLVMLSNDASEFGVRLSKDF